MSLQERMLAWEGCLNVRDLGGHRTAEGGETRFGAVVRADSVRELTAAGWQALVDYGISRIVDLRQHSELEADPPLEIPVQVAHVPLFPEPGSAHWEEIGAVGDAAADPIAATRLVYLECLERFRVQVAGAVGAVAEAPDGGVVVHCRAGKDRTGIVSALLLRLVGVSRAEVATDYALTEEILREPWAAWVEGGSDRKERERRRRLAAAPAEAMVQVLEELETRYGDVRSYLRAGGAPDGTLDALVDRLRA